MPRPIFPPFQHKSGSTELDHAIDARAMDEAFSELANTLNGGIDETNLSSGVKFSTVSPGAPSVNTALAAKYATVILSRKGPSAGAISRDTVGSIMGSGWIPFYCSIYGETTAFSGAGTSTIDVGATGTGTTLITVPAASMTYLTTDFSSDAVVKVQYSGPISSGALTAGHTLTFNNANLLLYKAVAVAFKVPVL